MNKTINRTSYFKLLILITVLFLSISTTTKRVDAAGAQIPYSFFLEHPYSITGLRGNIEFIDLDDNGWLIMNAIRGDINIQDNLFGIYAKFPFSGVTNFGTNDDSEYDFGNLSAGTKLVLLNLDNAALTGGFEVFFPTSSNGLGSFGALNYFRDVAAFGDDTWTFKPYAVFGISGGDIFAFQANLDFDFIANAESLDTVFNTGGDSSELILKYGATVSVTPELPLPFATSFLVELLLASSVTFDENITGAYLTPGIRVGGQLVSVGAGVEIPFGSSEVTNFANVGFLLDLIIRFGS